MCRSLGLQDAAPRREPARLPAIRERHHGGWCRPPMRTPCSRTSARSRTGVMPCARRAGTFAAARRENAAILALPFARARSHPRAVSHFLRKHPDVKFDLQTVHHDDLFRKLYERETGHRHHYQVPPAAPISQRWLGEGDWFASTAGGHAGRPTERRAAMPARTALHQPRRERAERAIFTEELERLDWSWTRSSPPHLLHGGRAGREAVG